MRTNNPPIKDIFVVLPRELRISVIAVVGVLSLLGPLVASGSHRANAMTSGAAKTARATCALTGRTAPATTARRPAVAVRISNSPDAGPQTGIGTADLVVETLTEGGTTRLIAFFHCSPAKEAGPVRSARLDDAAIVTPFSKLFAYSGANAAVQKELGSSSLTNVTELTPGEALYRTSTDPTDVNSVRAKVVTLRSLARVAGHAKPAMRFQFGSAQRGPSVSTIALEFGSTSVGYRWRKGTWTRTQDGTAVRDAAGRLVKTTNVLVQEVDANASTSLFDSAGVASPKFDLVGSGKAVLFRSGRAIQGTWTDTGAGAPVFRTKGGSVMKLARGTTWLEMVPSPDGDLQGQITYN